jgi:hypothetical protein
VGENAEREDTERENVERENAECGLMRNPVEKLERIKGAFIMEASFFGGVRGMYFNVGANC